MCSRAKVRLRGKSGQALHCQCAECLAAWCKTVRASCLNVQKLRILKLFLNIWKCKVLFSQKVYVLYLIGWSLVPIAVFASRAEQCCRWFISDKKREILIHLFYPSPRRIKAGVFFFLMEKIQILDVTDLFKCEFDPCYSISSIFYKFTRMSCSSQLFYF